MWPERRPGRGSGASPRNRSAARASTIWASPSFAVAATWVTSRTRPASRRAVKWRSRRMGDAVLDRAALGPPLGQAAVEDGDVGLAEEPERPPDARGAEHADAVVDDDAVAVADAEARASG